MMPWTRFPLAAALAAAGLWLGAGPVAGAGGLCDALFVPTEYGLTCAPYTTLGEGEAEAAVVEPAEGAFAPLSQLVARRLDEPVEDPEAWLRRQMSFDFDGLDEYVADLGSGVDSPFAGTDVGSALVDLAGQVESLGLLPLEGCERATPEVDGHTIEELRCAYEAGPLAQYVVVRLLDKDGETYAFTARAMNEQRLRHLLAIVNTFAAA